MTFLTFIPAGLENLGLRAYSLYLIAFFRKPWYWLSPIRGSSSLCAQKQNEEHRKMFLVLLARPAGFEPATYRFVAGHSIH